jgi:hypothetical protein
MRARSLISGSLTPLFLRVNRAAIRSEMGPMGSPINTPTAPPTVTSLELASGQLYGGAVMTVGKEYEMKRAPVPIKIPYAQIVQSTYCH